MMFIDLLVSISIALMVCSTIVIIYSLYVGLKGDDNYKIYAIIGLLILLLGMIGMLYTGVMYEIIYELVR